MVEHPQVTIETKYYHFFSIQFLKWSGRRVKWHEKLFDETIEYCSTCIDFWVPFDQRSQFKLLNYCNKLCKLFLRYCSMNMSVFHHGMFRTISTTFALLFKILAWFIPTTLLSWSFYKKWWRDIHVARFKGLSQSLQTLCLIISSKRCKKEER